jgi:hypothetical protein
MYLIQAKYIDDKNLEHVGYLSYHKNECPHFLENDKASKLEEFTDLNEAQFRIRNILSAQFDILNLSYWPGASKDNISLSIVESIRNK